MARGAAAVDLAFSVHGPAEGPVVVLLHGFPLARQMWKAQTQALAERGFRVVTPDLRGHGESPVLEDPATMERCAADVFKVMDGLGRRTFFLGGFSMGGYVALEMAAQHPERVHGLLLVDTRAEPDSADARRRREATARKVVAEGPVVVAEEMLPKLITERTRRLNPEVAQTVLHMMLNMDPSGMAAALRGLAQRPDRRDALGTIRVPTLVIVGDSDELTPPEASRTMARGIPGARLVVIKRAGHLAPIERPDEVSQAMVEFLEAHAHAVVRAG